MGKKIILDKDLVNAMFDDSKSIVSSPLISRILGEEDSPSIMFNGREKRLLRNL